MNTKIAENIRKLRKRKDITQEELSNFLGVSYQAISKWERGEGFPDITLLPSLANFFEISIDDLFGMDQIRSQEYLSEVYIKEHELVKQRKYDQAIDLLRNALKTFPSNYSLMSELAIALSFSDQKTKEGRGSIKEAITLCNHVIENSTSEKVRSTTRTLLCFLYKSIDEEANAVALAKTLPHCWEGRELVLPNILNYPSNKESLNESTKLILATICEMYRQLHKDNAAFDYHRMISIGSDSIDNSISDLETIMQVLAEVYS